MTRDIEMEISRQLEDAVCFEAFNVKVPNERAMVLDRACLDNGRLRFTVEEMLAASEELSAAAYVELRRLASARLARDVSGEALPVAALLHEAWRQLMGEDDRNLQSRAHYFANVARAMRRILSESALRKTNLKREEGCLHGELEDVNLQDIVENDNMLIINEALAMLEENREQSQIVVLKFFGGLTNDEVALALGIGESAVYRQWVCSKARLYRWVRQKKG
jgi:RNA polymerase sigma factor (TIGR02999 family)